MPDPRRAAVRRGVHEPAGASAQTARLAGFVDAEVLDDLREWDYGVYEGRTTSEIREEIPGWSVWRDPIVDGESVEQVAIRVRWVLDRCAPIEGRVVLFAHAHVLRILTAGALGLDPGAGQVLALDPGGIGVVGWEHENRALRAWNRPT